MDKPDLCGMDVSAQQLVVMVRRDGKTEPVRSFANNKSGHQELKRYLTRQRTGVRVCLESTGLYGLDIALLLQADTRIEVMVANPRAVKDFARALMHRSKTDPLDALVLLEYAARMPFQAWHPPCTAALQVTALGRRIHALSQQCTMEKNRLHAVATTQNHAALNRARPAPEHHIAGNGHSQTQPGSAQNHCRKRPAPAPVSPLAERSWHRTGQRPATARRAIVGSRQL